LSYSGGSGKSFGSNRGSSAQRKDKKKKQDFHKHHLKFVPEQEQLSLEQLKERVSIGLQKLGTQVFSSEPGGYGFHNWMSSFNLLLDDFEEKCGPENLPKEYHDERLRLTAELLEPVNTSELDLEMERLQKEISSVEEQIAEIVQKSEMVAVEEWREDDAKISRLKKERTQTDLDITSTRTKLDEEKRKANQSVYKRLFSRSDTIKPIQASLESLAARREEIEENLRSLEKDRTEKKSEVRKYDSDLSKLRLDLEGLRIQLGETEGKKSDKLQLSDKRGKITESMARMISTLRLNAETSSNES
jgi:chromosome segregation ATPase